MKHLYIIVDLATRKVVYEAHNLEACKNFEQAHQNKALYLITLLIDNNYPCCRGLEGVAL